MVVFAITQVLPADAAVMLLGENATPEALAAVRQQLGLDEPVVAAILALAVGACCSGDFGTSMRTGQPVGAGDVRGARPFAAAGRAWRSV